MTALAQAQAQAVPLPPPASASASVSGAVVRDLADRLAARAEHAGVPAPVVVSIGYEDVLTRGRDPFAGLRRDAAIHLTADSILVGPRGGAPDAAACGGCLAMRWQRLRTRSERDALENGFTPRIAYAAAARAGAGHAVAPAPWPVLLPYAVDAAWSAYANADVSVSAPHMPESPTDRHGLPQVARIDLATLHVRTASLFKEPQCPYCTAPEPLPDPGSDLESGLVSRAKSAPGAYRHDSPASYRLPADALANPVCGVLGAATWLDVTSPTTAPVAGTVFMRGYAGLTDVTWSGQGNAFAVSRDLAFLEGLERYAGTHSRRGEPPVVAAYDDVAGEALDPRACGMYAPATYAEDPMLDPFDPARPIPWVRGYSLRDRRPVLVPARLCYYSAGLRADNFVFECSNGCAIGGSLEEAVLFGLLELIERDAFLLGWYGNASLTRIDLDSCASPALRAMIDRAGLQGYDVRVFDNRVDLAVPVVTGLAVRRDRGPGTLAFAAAAAFDERAAVEGAVAEILTYLPHLPRQVAERPDELAAMARDHGLVRRLPDHAALFGLPEMAVHAESYLSAAGPGRPLDELYEGWQQRRPRTLDLLDDLALCLEELTGAGFDVIAVDQTPPEQERLGLRTVCTLVPGLLPIDFGWSRQRALESPRLRTAFRRAGWRTTDLREDELRRVPHPFP